jgi:hypothetical protein
MDVTYIAQIPAMEYASWGHSVSIECVDLHRSKLTGDIFRTPTERSGSYCGAGCATVVLLVVCLYVLDE